MKKVAIVTWKLVFGGIETALLKMINNMPKDKYDITIIIVEKGGDLEKKLPDHVKLKYIFENEPSIGNKIKISLKNMKIINASKLVIYTLLSRINRNIYTKDHYFSKKLNVLEEKYDMAISYTTPVSFPIIYTINNIRAKNKIMWLHSDIEQFEDQIKYYSKYYNKYDYLFSVSEKALSKFIKKLPEFKSKSEVFYNSIYEDDIKQLAKQEKVLEDDFRYIKIVTVARLSSEKGIDLAIRAAKNLIDNGFKIKWYIVGDGKDRTQLEQMIIDYNLENKFILLGSKENPFSYINECDIYVQPSRYEGYCNTITEAKCLKKLIVSTNTNGGIEQIKHMHNGIIVNINHNDIYYGISELINNNTLRQTIENNLKASKIDTRNEVKKLLKFN